MAKKKSKGARRASTAQDQDRRQQRLEARRQAKVEALAARRKAERRARFVRIGVMSAVAAGLVLFFFVQTQPPNTPDEIGGHPVQKLGESGTNNHVTGTVEYDSTPPVHGAHAPQPGACGVHAEAIPDENQVHSLEHGAVGIQYRPDVDPQDIEKIEDIARSFDASVFSAPYPGMATPIAVSSWGELMRLETLDTGAINDYIAQFRGEGPEEGASCSNSVDSPFVPPGADEGGDSSPQT
ncbi:DUF3105 domain-containing protein [soil metagenome]